uniref:Uncharacterized protein n=1 Tax=Lotharella globosa TaxID=91324 RepID=A0A7S3ZBI7_9EUKA
MTHLQPMEYHAFHSTSSSKSNRWIVASLAANVALVGTILYISSSSEQQAASLGAAVKSLPQCSRAVNVHAAGGRRGFVTGGLGAVALMGMVRPQESKAGLKFPGTMPSDLGVRGDGSLKTCPSTSNCWSTSATDASHKSQPFSFSKSTSEAVEDLKEVLNSYPKEGQQIDEKTLVDGGGWRMIKNNGGYFQLEYESKKFGFVDDVEFNVEDGKVQYRSASRQGDSDFGVNAYRLNFIADGLKKKGWSTPGFPLTTAAQR